MEQGNGLAQRFEEQRPRLRGVAYRMLGSLPEADDALQETWLRLSRSEADDIEDLPAWLTTVVARVCLNVLRSRKLRREEPVGIYVPDALISFHDEVDPEYEAVLADSVGLALQVVLDTLAPAERLAFVLHDMFDVPFDEIASMVGRTPDAARQLASRARRRVKGAAPAPEGAVAEQRQVVDAFFAAARGGDFEALVSVLDPDVVLRSDGGPSRPKLSRVIRGAEAVARSATGAALPNAVLRPVLVNGAAGVMVLLKGQLFTVMAFTVRNGKVVELDVLADPERLSQLSLREA
jgi:RNA polymerase sigma-70 factor (ECF subfamily)